MSGIYIKGIEMPTRCGLCRFCVQEMTGDIDYHFECAVTAETITHKIKRTERRGDCPLVPVPDHGRLIDGDELARGCDDPYWCRWLSEIEDAPTIIPADHIADIGNMADKEVGE